jgi:hypothetical protein
MMNRFHLRGVKEPAALFALAVTALAVSLTLSVPLAAGRDAASSLKSKIATIEANEKIPGPHPDVTITAAEANAYFADPASLPKGVSNFKVSSAPAEIAGAADIDFDQLKAQHSGNLNPLVAMLFSGVHHVTGRAHVDSAIAPDAQLTIDEVAIDGEVIPNNLIDFAIREFVAPKYPEIGRTFKVSLPNNVKSVTVGDNQVTLHY